MDVQYEAENFIDKNKDTVPDEHLALLQGSDFDFLTDVLDKAAANTAQAAVSLSFFFKKKNCSNTFIFL